VKQLIVLPALLAIFAMPGLSQPPDTLWTRTYGTIWAEGARAMEITSDGGCIIVGQTFPNDTSDIYLLKVNSLGDTLWTRTYGGWSWEAAYDVKQTYDGGYVIVGETNSFGEGYPLCFVKTDSSGNQQWLRTFSFSSENIGFATEQCTDGGYLIAGVVHHWNPYESHALPISPDCNGDTLWTRLYGGETGAGAYDIEPTSDGNYIFAGHTGTSGWEVLLVKIDGNGDILWQRSYNPDLAGGACCIKETSDGGFIVGAYVTVPCMYADIYVLRTDANGDTLWTRIFTFPNADEFVYDVVETADHGFVFVGRNSPGYLGDDVYAFKIADDGVIQWEQNYGGLSSDGAYAIEGTGDGGFLLAGATSSFGAGAGDVYLIRLGPEEPPSVPHGKVEMFAKTFALHPAYPNPFNSSTVLRYEVPMSGPVRLTIHNLLGQQVATVVDRTMSVGSYSAIWNASNMPSGIYFCRLSTPGFQSVRKMVLIR